MYIHQSNLQPKIPNIQNKTENAILGEILKLTNRKQQINNPRKWRHIN